MSDFRVIGNELIHAPQNRNPHIETVWVVLSVDQAGEGVCAGPAPGGFRALGVDLMTYMVAEEKLVPVLTKMAEELAKKTGTKLKLVKFTTRTDLRIIGE